jgi:hypothetical protein
LPAACIALVASREVSERVEHLLSEGEALLGGLGTIERRAHAVSEVDDLPRDAHP